MDNKYHFKRLVRIAKNADMITSETFEQLFNIGLNNNLDEDVISHVLAKKTKKIDLEKIDPWKRFKYFYSLVQMMHMDQPQYKKELNFCIDLAAWLGYDPVFLNRLIAGIFNNDNPDILPEEIIVNPVTAG